MKEYLASRLVAVARNIVNAQIDPRLFDEEEEIETVKSDLRNCAKEIWEECRFLGLPCTQRQGIRLGGYAKAAEHKKEEIGTAADVLSQRFDDEIEALKLFYVPTDKITFYNKADLFGEQFKVRFPTANFEVIEAGNCFAFDRFTACVSHLTRAMEIALRVLFVSLGMPPRIWSTTKWSKILDRIKGKIDKNNKTLANDEKWKEERPFYENAHAFLAAARVPIRNSTMHVESVYDEAGAENVFGAVKSFMRHLASKLKESS